MESCEYVLEFLILQPRKKHNGYLIILGRSWLATSIAYIDYRSGTMTIHDGKGSKQLSLYPPAQLTFEYVRQMWVDEPEFDIMENVATLAMIIVKEHFKEMEEHLEESEREASLQQQLFDIPTNEQT